MYVKIKYVTNRIHEKAVISDWSKQMKKTLL